MNVLFWNIDRKDTKDKKQIEDYIINCIEEHDVDIAVFAEYKEKDTRAARGKTNIDRAAIENGLGNMYEWITGIEADGAVTLLARKSLGVVKKICQDDRKRYSLYVIDTPLKKYLLVAIHLEDRKSDPNSQRREATINRLKEAITNNEEDLDLYSTIVIGDFNANPYDKELTSMYNMNAVLFKSVIKANEFTCPDTDMVRRFYNPIINYLSEDTEMYGSYYYPHPDTYWTPYWCCLDQVLVRKGLVDSIKEVRYLKDIQGDSLLKATKIPQPKISDHLPLLVKFEEA